VPLVGLELEERLALRSDGLTAGFDANRPVEHEQKHGLLHAMVAERLAGPELDEHRTRRGFSRVQHGRRPRTVRCLDFGQSPVTHEGPFPYLPGQ
jgi:hypothetical protein